jgi:AcrR family transcriptional regulator
MDRTQAAIVAGVGSCLATHGARRTTMIDIAAAAGIAKGTLYNHVRTKAEAFALYADAEVARLLDLIGADGLVAAADAVGGHPVPARMRAEEPAALAALLLAAAGARPRVVEALEDVLGPAAALAYRWLVSLLVEPADHDERVAEAQLLSGQAR